jgi:hypothetical protein
LFGPLAVIFKPSHLALHSSAAKYDGDAKNEKTVHGE